jgi:hypothetical protein
LTINLAAFLTINLAAFLMTDLGGPKLPGVPISGPEQAGKPSPIGGCQAGDECGERVGGRPIRDFGHVGASSGTSGRLR